MNLVIANRQRIKRIDTRFLKQVTAATLAELQISEGDLGIHLVGAREMARVNWQFLQHEGSTDVITFDHAEGGGTLHGELFICVEDAIQQAREFKTDWTSEVIRYVVHGILHLRGYDDLKPHLRRVMKREENRLVRLLARKFSFAQLERRATI
ncbi:MAG TPA: rRNA maturation RNase YbeY [Verrucomicrobiae bacterium]